MSNSRKQYLYDEISMRQTRISNLRQEVAHLERELRAIEVRELNLPTEPGFYEIEDGVARLHPDGTWSDGWGNPWDSDMEYLQNAIPLVRKEDAK